MDDEMYFKLKKIINDFESKKDPLEEILVETSQQVTMEDTHKRQTFLIRKDLVNRLNELKLKRKRGFITRFVNYAIESSLDRIDEFNDEK